MYICESQSENKRDKERERERKRENERAILTGSLIVGWSGLSARTHAGSVGPLRSISAAQHSPLILTSKNKSNSVASRLVASSY